MRLTVALRSPVAFRLPGPLTLEAMAAPAEPVSIEFEERTFVWHPPMETESAILGREQLGPMVAVIVAGDPAAPDAAASLQRFLSAVAFWLTEPVTDVSGNGGDGGSDAFNPHGNRERHAFSGTRKVDAPAAIAVFDDATLRIALAYFREGLGAGSPFYECVAFRNVLDVVYDVVYEKVKGVVTAEAACRDSFIDAEASRLAGWHGLEEPRAGWAAYLRDEVRNALSHVRREGHRREVNPDAPEERRRFRRDAVVLQRLAEAAIRGRWPHPIAITPRP